MTNTKGRRTLKNKDFEFGNYPQADVNKIVYKLITAVDNTTERSFFAPFRVVDIRLRRREQELT